MAPFPRGNTNKGLMSNSTTLLELIISTTDITASTKASRSPAGLPRYPLIKGYNFSLDKAYLTSCRCGDVSG